MTEATRGEKGRREAGEAKIIKLTDDRRARPRQISDDDRAELEPSPRSQDRRVQRQSTFGVYFLDTEALTCAREMKSFGNTGASVFRLFLLSSARLGD